MCVEFKSKHCCAYYVDIVFVAPTNWNIDPPLLDTRVELEVERRDVLKLTQRGQRYMRRWCGACNGPPKKIILELKLSFEPRTLWKSKETTTRTVRENTTQALYPWSSRAANKVHGWKDWAKGLMQINEQRRKTSSTKVYHVHLWIDRPT